MDATDIARKGHAVVVGGSMAGLLTARVLADHFERVTLVVRDALTGDAGLRKGVPQGRQLHVLLPRGRVIVERPFPATTGSWGRQGRCPSGCRPTCSCSCPRAGSTGGPRAGRRCRRPGRCWKGRCAGGCGTGRG